MEEATKYLFRTSLSERVMYSYTSVEVNEHSAQKRPSQFSCSDTPVICCETK